MPDSPKPKAIAIPQGRTDLYQFLLDLPGSQFEAVLFDLKPPRGNVPPSSAAQGDRVSALMIWVESPSIGPGIDALRASLDRVLNTFTEPKNASAIRPFDPPESTEDRNIAIGQSVERSNLVSGDRNYIDQSHTVNHYYGLPKTQPASSRSDRNERTLIDAVWTEVDDRLRQSLHNAILIRLDMAEQRSQVSRPWDSELRTADQKPKTLEPGMHIAEVFDRRDVGGKLLVLGHPGAGKTTTMLDLAAALVQRANGDPGEPIPVMVNLSSWQNPKQSFADWLLNELKLKYGVSAKLGQTWMSEKKLLPLMDGLDELPPDRQEPAVRGINTWLQSETGAPRLLVCSRLEEYELYAAKLDLNGAICLSPLTDEQLNSYLTSLKMAHLWETLQHDNALLALVRTPLLLSVSILANDDLDRTQWSQLQTTQDRLCFLLDAYILQRLNEPVSSKYYSLHKQPTTKQIRHWLAWVAKQLKEQSQDEFLIEKIQPKALISNRQKNIYGLVTGINIGLIFGTLLSLVVKIFIGPNDTFILVPVFGAILGCMSGLVFQITTATGKLKAVEKLSFSLSSFVAVETLRGLFQGVLFGTLLWALLRLSSPSLPLFPMLIFHGSGFAFIFGFAASVKASEIKLRVKPNQGIIHSLKNTMFLLSMLCVLISILSPTLIDILSLYLDDHTVYVISYLLVLLIFVAFSIGGGVACIQHLAIRVALYNTGCIPWNYARFLNHCTEQRLLQRVGGRYRFIHRLVQERFAAMSLDR